MPGCIGLPDAGLGLDFIWPQYQERVGRPACLSVPCMLSSSMLVVQLLMLPHHEAAYARSTMLCFITQ